MFRTFDAAFLNIVANHPEVRPWLGGEGVADLSEQTADTDNVVLQGEAGGFGFFRVAPGLYDLHALFLPSAWGQEPRKMIGEALAYLFAETDCEVVLMSAPTANRRIASFAHACGFLPGRRFAAVDAAPFTMTRQRFTRLQTEGGR